MMSLSLAIAAFAVWLFGQPPTPIEADWDWLNANRDAALEAVMPLQPTSRPIIAYRSYRDLYHDQMEKYFSIDFVGGAGPRRQSLTATIVLPVERSIQQQVLEARIRDRREATSSVFAGIKIHQVNVTEAECPMMKERLSKIPDLRLFPEVVDKIILHPVVHRIVTDQYGVAVDAKVIDSDHPLVRWVGDMHDVLLTCMPANRPLQPTSGTGA